MKITGIEAIELEAPLERPWRIATATMTSLFATLVRVHTDDGHSGTGECIVRLGPGVTGAVVREVLAPVVIGRDPQDVEGIWDAMYETLRRRGHSRGFLLEAMSGVDIAIWDLLGRRFGLPVAKLLAGHGRGDVPTYASSILLDTPDTMAEEARRLVADGFSAIKMKVGGEVALDAARITAVREAAGDATEIMLDANSGYDVPSAIAVAKAAERLGVYWLEEPVPPDDLPGYRRIREATRLRIAAGESEFTAPGCRALVAENLIDVVQPDIARAGGFTGCRRIAALADAYNRPVAPHTGASGPVCIAATVHLAAALPNFLVYEHMYLSNPLSAILRAPTLEPDRGRLRVPTAPGLGLEFDEAAIERFTRHRVHAG